MTSHCISTKNMSDHEKLKNKNMQKLKYIWLLLQVVTENTYLDMAVQDETVMLIYISSLYQICINWKGKKTLYDQYHYKDPQNQ